MTLAELGKISRILEQAGWRWDTWSGSFLAGNCKGWWFLPGAEGAKGMRRGDPQLFDLATVTAYKLYIGVSE